jgi:DNA repair protein RecO (recombination protein O)
MKPHGYSDEAIVLARRNYGEADRILVVFSKHHGKLSLMAKGVRRPKSRKRGHIEVFNKISFGAAQGRALDIMTEAEVVDPFAEIKQSLRKVSLAYYMMEVIGKTTHEESVHPEVYEFLADNLEKLKTAKLLKNLRLKFIKDLLVLLGFWPKGKELIDPDAQIKEIVERNINSIRIGKMLSED